MGTEAVKAFRRTWEPRAKRASNSPSSKRSWTESAPAGRSAEPPPTSTTPCLAGRSAAAPKPANGGTPLPRPSEAALRIQAEGGERVRRTSGIRLKPQTASLETRVAPLSEEVPTQPSRNTRTSEAAPPIDRRVQVNLANLQIAHEPPRPAPAAGRSVQKTFLAPNKRNSREPTDHDVQVISVYAPPPLPKCLPPPRRARSQADAYEVEILVDDSHETPDPILETQVIPLVEEAPRSRWQRSLLTASVLVLAGAAGAAAYTFAPKLVRMLRLPASVAAVSDASRPLPTPVVRPTQTVATPAVPVPSEALQGVVVTQGIPPAGKPAVPHVFAIVSQQAAQETNTAIDTNEATRKPAIGASEGGATDQKTMGATERHSPTSADVGQDNTSKASETKAVRRAKHKKIRRLRARHKRQRARAQRAERGAIAAPEK